MLFNVANIRGNCQYLMFVVPCVLCIGSIREVSYINIWARHVQHRTETFLWKLLQNVSKPLIMDSKYRSKPGKCHIVEVAEDQGKADNQVLRDICSMVQNSTKELQSIKKVVQQTSPDSGKGQGSGKSNQKTSGKPNLSNVQCFKCKGYGHYQKYCPLGKSGTGSSRMGDSKTKLN